VSPTFDHKQRNMGICFSNPDDVSGGGGGGAATKAAHHVRNVFATPFEMMDLATYRTPVHEHTPEETKLIESALKKNFVFEQMSAKESLPLVKAFEKTNVASGEVVIKQGDEGNYFYVILKGSFVFEVDGKEVGRAKAGDSFGELALLYNCPRAATVKAAEESVLFRVDQKTFRYILQAQTKEGSAEKMKLLKGVDFLKDLGDVEINKLIDVMTPKKFAKGEYLMKKGDEADNFWIVEEGKAKVANITAGNTKYEDLEIGPGQYAGERAIMTGEKRAADVIAQTDVLAFGIDKDTFATVLGELEYVIQHSMDKQRLVCSHSRSQFHLNCGCLRRSRSVASSRAVAILTSKPNRLLSNCLSIQNSMSSRIRRSPVSSRTNHSPQVPSLRPPERKPARRRSMYVLSRTNCICRSIDRFQISHRDLFLLLFIQIIRSGQIESKKADGTTVMLEMGANAGVDTLKADVISGKNGKTDPTSIVATETLTVKKECVCGVLTLRSLRKVLNTVYLGTGKKEVIASETSKTDIKLESLKRHTLLGAGTFGQVWLVSSPNKEPYALKIQSKYELVQDGQAKAVVYEKNVMARVSSPLYLFAGDLYKFFSILRSSLFISRRKRWTTLLSSDWLRRKCLKTNVTDAVTELDGTTDMC